MTVYEAANMAIYINGVRMPVESMQITEKAEIYKPLTPIKPARFEFTMPLTDDGRRFFESVERLTGPPKRTRLDKKRASRFWQNERRNLVRIAGHHKRRREIKVKQDRQALYKSLGVHVPRSLR